MNGSYPVYTVNWGDGTSMGSVSHVDKLSPEPVYMEHTYTGDATYTLSVNATDKKGRVLGAYVCLFFASILFRKN